MFESKITVSIGIPAYNESGNIRKLLESLLKQEQTRYQLKEIIVISDGSTDTTAEEVRKVHDPRIRFINDRKRKGKSARMTEIMSAFTSEILVFLDADILPASTQTINELILPFQNNSYIKLVSGKPIQKESNTFFERIMQVSAYLQDYLKHNIKNGNTIYACHGRIVALHRSLIQIMRIPLSIAGNDAYMYLSCIRYGLGFHYAYNARVYFRMPGTFRDFKKQRNRFQYTVHQELIKEFGDLVINEFHIPKMVIFKAFITSIIRFPFLSILYYIVFLVSMVFQFKIESTWSMSESTKKI